MMGLGIFGDYWPDQDSFWIGVGFMFELTGMLVLWVGAILYGIVAINKNTIPGWIGYGLIAIGPGGILGMFLLAHIPSGPLLGYVLFWLLAGIRLIWKPHEI